MKVVKVLTFTLCLFVCQSAYANFKLAECHDCTSMRSAAMLVGESSSGMLNKIVVYDYTKNMIKQYIYMNDLESGTVTVTEINVPNDIKAKFNRGRTEWEDAKAAMSGDRYISQTNLSPYDVAKDAMFANQVLDDYKKNASLYRKINNSLGYLLNNLSTSLASVKGMNFLVTITLTNNGVATFSFVGMTTDGDVVLELTELKDSEGRVIPLDRSGMYKNSPYVYYNSSPEKSENYGGFLNLSNWYGISMGGSSGGSAVIIDCNEDTGCRKRAN